MSRDEGPRPGYLVVRADGGAYLGGLMVTDVDGLPVDFRYTDPVTPTRLQKALYGGVLDRYLRGEVLLGTLLGAIEKRPSVLLVDDRELVEHASAEVPVAYVEPTGLDPIGEPGTTRVMEGESGLLVQASPGRPPLRVILSSGTGGDAVAAALVGLAERIDVMEPSERVRNALDVIAAGGGDE